MTVTTAGSLPYSEPIPSRIKWPILISAAILLLIQTLTLLSARWVEDENWYSVPPYTLLTRGEIRMPIYMDSAGQARTDVRPPLTVFIMAGFFKVFGTSLYSAKAPYLLSGLACIFLTYLLGCELGRPWVGLIGAVFLATDNLFFLASRTTRPEAMVAAFSMLGILVYLYSRRKNSAGLAFLSGLIVGLGALVHVNGLAIAISAGIFALVEFRWSIFRRARPWAFLAGLLIPLAFYVAWGTSDQLHRNAFFATYRDGEGWPLSAIPMLERNRYRDFLGVGSMRVNLPANIPTRLHIVLALFAAAIVLYYYDRDLLKTLLCLIVPAVFWWAFLRNMTSRYIATAAPYLALLFSGAVISLWHFRPRWRTVVAACAALILLSQVAGNALLIYLYRQADYASVTRELQAVIPPDAHVFGALTFWMALHDHPYYSWNRTTVKYAIDHGVNYLVLNDRVLIHGSGQGTDDWAGVRNEAAAFVKDHATLVGHAPNPFYGDLEIYKVNPPVAVPNSPQP